MGSNPTLSAENYPRHSRSSGAGPPLSEGAAVESGANHREPLAECVRWEPMGAERDAIPRSAYLASPRRSDNETGNSDHPTRAALVRSG